MVLDETPMGGNYFCAAGASQGFVHIAALFLTLAEVPPNAFTTVRCAWTRASAGSKVCTYVPYSEPQPHIGILLQDLLNAGSMPGVADYFNEKKVRVCCSCSCNCEVLLQDPLDKLTGIAKVSQL